MLLRDVIQFGALLLLPAVIAVVAYLAGAEFHLPGRYGDIVLSPLWFLIFIVGLPLIAIRYQQILPLHGLLVIAGLLLLDRVFALTGVEPFRGFQWAFAVAVLVSGGFGLAKLRWDLD